MISSPYPLQLTLNQFLSAPEGLKQDVCRFSAIQAHTVSGPKMCPYHLCTMRVYLASILGVTALKFPSTSLMSKNLTPQVMLYW